MSDEETGRRDAVHHFRLNRFVGLEPEHLEASIDAFKHEQLPSLSQQAGFRTIFFGQNLTDGIAAGVTIWRTASELRSSEAHEAAARRRAVGRAGGAMGAGIVDRHRIIFEHHRDAPEDPTHARLVHWDGVWPSRISNTVARFTAEQVPMLESVEGYVGILIGADFQAGSAASITLWSSAEALEASLEWERGARGAVESDGLTPRRMFADNYEVVLAPVLRQLAPWRAWHPEGHARFEPVESYA